MQQILHTASEITYTHCGEMSGLHSIHDDPGEDRITRLSDKAFALTLSFVPIWNRLLVWRILLVLFESSLRWNVSYVLSDYWLRRGLWLIVDNPITGACSHVKSCSSIPIELGLLADCLFWATAIHAVGARSGVYMANNGEVGYAMVITGLSRYECRVLFHQILLLLLL